jgi:hypothetical protein
MSADDLAVIILRLRNLVFHAATESRVTVALVRIRKPAGQPT